MKRTAIVFSPIYYQHNTGKGHPEKAKRLKAIVKEVSEWNKLGQKRNIQFVKPEKAQNEDVELVHMPEYVKLVEAVCKAGGGLLDLQDTVVSSNSFDVALYAVGGTLTATHLIMEGKNRNAFALVRPPGHHATRHRALGFCLFNNAAIAAQHLIEKFNLKRILILDLDAHHGNGTQEIFYATDKVLYVSLHEDPAGFPGTGFAEETGKVDGKGFNVNVPLPFGTGDSEYLQAINEIAMPIARQ
ncbi:MAG: histone deacetylase, partial [Candidatus Bathyarchaeia archaeon]